MLVSKKYTEIATFLLYQFVSLQMKMSCNEHIITCQNVCNACKLGIDATHLFS